MKLSVVSILSPALLLCLLSLLFPAASQIVGCDTLDCETESDPSDETECASFEYGVGTSQFTSNVSLNGPLTWTIGGWSDNAVGEGAPKGAQRLTKNFYLGTPSTLLLQNADFHGCNLLFFNITSALQTPPDYTDFADFGCDTVMGNQCVQELLNQVTEELNGRLDAVSATEPSICRPVADAIQRGGLPESCNFPPGFTSWGPINDAVFAAYDNTSILSSPQEDCDITGLGSSSNLALTNLVYKDLQPDSEEGQLWLNGTTPLITMFFNRAGDNNGALLSPEVHLNCLRTVPSAEEQNAGSVVAGPAGMLLVELSVVSALLLCS